MQWFREMDLSIRKKIPIASLLEGMLFPEEALLQALLGRHYY